MNPSGSPSLMEKFTSLFSFCKRLKPTNHMFVELQTVSEPVRFEGVAIQRRPKVNSCEARILGAEMHEKEIIKKRFDRKSSDARLNYTLG